MKLVSLLSGGIDSPVASYIMSKRGADVILLHMNNGAYADKKEIEKVELITKKLREVTGKELPLYILDHETNQTLIKKHCDSNYQCVMCKRMMQYAAREFARKNGCSGIIMGDSLGQVASQTLKNIRAECCDLGFPIIRPLIGMDKNEIIQVAKEIGTFEISIIQTSGCAAVPLKPITEARPEKVIELQKKIDFDKAIEACVNSAVLHS